MRNNVSRSLFYILLTFLIFSCSFDTSDKQAHAIRQDTLPLPTDSSTFYFPMDSTESELSEERSWVSLVNNWYSHMLFALHEPVLYKYTGESEIYRFTWLRSFDNPVAIRVQKQGGNFTLLAKVTSGAGGYEPGQMKMDTSFKISQKQWEEFTTLLTRARFWNLPTTVNEGGKDGARWILEGVSNKKYHWVDRWSPTSGEYKEACEYLLSLSRVPIHSNRGYY